MIKLHGSLVCLEEQLITGLQKQTNTACSTSPISIKDNGQKCSERLRSLKNIFFKMINVSWFKCRKLKFIIWFTVVLPRNISRRWRKLLHMVKNGGADDSTFTDGQESFFKWSSMVVALMEQTPKAKQTSSQSVYWPSFVITDLVLV